MSEAEPILNVARWVPRSVVNGPGERFVLWLQGCPFRCPGCYNPELLPFRTATAMTVDEILAEIRATEGIEGVTYSGGEPMAQAAGLAALSERVREDGLTVVCYTGYTREELDEAGEPGVARLLAACDLLIDGRYDRDQAAPLPWRGSRNQRVWFLTERYAHLAEEAARPEREVELILGDEGFVTTGVFSREFLAALRRELAEGE